MVARCTLLREGKHLCAYASVSFIKNNLYVKQKMGILEKIQEIEREIARTQKNKGKVFILL